MSFDRAPELLTPRLKLRGHRASDLDAYADMWAAPDVLEFTIREPRSRQDAWMTLQRQCGSWPLLGFGFWAVERRSDGAFLGEVGFMDAQRGLEPDISGAPEAGWAFAPHAFGQGYGTEAVTAAHTWLDSAYPDAPCAAIIDAANHASVRIAEKTGYSFAQSVNLHGTKTGLYRRRPLS